MATPMRLPFQWPWSTASWTPPVVPNPPQNTPNDTLASTPGPRAQKTKAASRLSATPLSKGSQGRNPLSEIKNTRSMVSPPVFKVKAMWDHSPDAQEHTDDAAQASDDRPKAARVDGIIRSEEWPTPAESMGDPSPMIAESRDCDASEQDESSRLSLQLGWLERLSSAKVEPADVQPTAAERVEDSGCDTTADSRSPGDSLRASSIASSTLLIGDSLRASSPVEASASPTANDSHSTSPGDSLRASSIASSTLLIGDSLRASSPVEASASVTANDSHSTSPGDSLRASSIASSTLLIGDSLRASSPVEASASVTANDSHSTSPGDSLRASSIASSTLLIGDSLRASSRASSTLLISMSPELKMSPHLLDTKVDDNSQKPLSAPKGARISRPSCSDDPIGYAGSYRLLEDQTVWNDESSRSASDDPPSTRSEPAAPPPPRTSSSRLSWAAVALRVVPRRRSAPPTTKPSTELPKKKWRTRMMAKRRRSARPSGDGAASERTKRSKASSRRSRSSRKSSNDGFSATIFAAQAPATFVMQRASNGSRASSGLRGAAAPSHGRGWHAAVKSKISKYNGSVRAALTERAAAGKASASAAASAAKAKLAQAAVQGAVTLAHAKSIQQAVASATAVASSAKVKTDAFRSLCTAKSASALASTARAALTAIENKNQHLKEAKEEATEPAAESISGDLIEIVAKSFSSARQMYADESDVLMPEGEIPSDGGNGMRQELHRVRDELSKTLAKFESAMSKIAKRTLPEEIQEEQTSVEGEIASPALEKSSKEDISRKSSKEDISSPPLENVSNDQIPSPPLEQMPVRVSLMGPIGHDEDLD